MQPRVLITRRLPEPALEVARQAGKVQLDPLDQQLTPEALRQAVKDADGLHTSAVPRSPHGRVWLSWPHRISPPYYAESDHRMW